MPAGAHALAARGKQRRSLAQHAVHGVRRQRLAPSGAPAGRSALDDGRATQQLGWVTARRGPEKASTILLPASISGSSHAVVEGLGQVVDVLAEARGDRTG